MNQNQLLKALKASNKVYSNVPKYADILRQAAILNISLGGISNKGKIAEAYTKVITTQAVALPFDNIFIDLHDYQMPHMLSGDLTNDNMALHIQPMTVQLKGHQMVVMLVIDWRLYGPALMHRIYLMYSDMSSLHVMPMVDSAAAASGCACFKRNVYSQNPRYWIEIMGLTPCFDRDVGFALPDCAGLQPACGATCAQKKEISDLIKILFAYMSLPTNNLVKVARNKMTKGNPVFNKPYYIYADKQQLEKLVSGDVKAEVSGNLFTDGAMILDFLAAKRQEVALREFSNKDKTYTIMDTSNENPSS